MKTCFDQETAAALTVALNSACDAIALPGLSRSGAASIRDRLSAVLLQLAAEGVRDPRLLCASAISRVPPSMAYYARHVR
jgi:hypothetical protein